MNEISLPGSYSDASAPSSEVDEVGRSEVVCGMSGYRPFDESDGLGGTERLLRIDHQIEQGINAVQLIVRDTAYGLFTHSTLVCVSR